MLPEVKVGTYTGTGAAQSITLGYKPSLVLAFNQTDGDTIWGHIKGMTAATAFSIDTEVAAESNACTLSATGFSLGTSSVINESGKVYLYVAFGNETLAADGS